MKGKMSKREYTSARKRNRIRERERSKRKEERIEEYGIQQEGRQEEFF
jgi:hypothetical protein